MRPASAALLCAALASAFAADPGADVVRVYNLPGTKECETDALKVCSMVVRMCASDETECELQCRSTQPPQISDACKATHPCAPDAENFCSDMAPGAIMACLKSNRDALAPTCKEVSGATGSRGQNECTPSAAHSAPFPVVAAWQRYELQRSMREWDLSLSLSPSHTLPGRAVALGVRARRATLAWPTRTSLAPRTSTPLPASCLSTSSTRCCLSSTLRSGRSTASALTRGSFRRSTAP